DVDVDELRGEVKVALPVVVPEVASFGSGDCDRVDRVLRRPRVEDVLLRILDDPCAEVGVGLDNGHLRSFARVRRSPRTIVAASYWLLEELCAVGAELGGRSPAHLRARLGSARRSRQEL